MKPASFSFRFKISENTLELSIFINIVLYVYYIHLVQYVINSELYYLIQFRLCLMNHIKQFK